MTSVTRAIEAKPTGTTPIAIRNTSSLAGCERASLEPPHALRDASRLKQYTFGRSLKTGDQVIVAGTAWVWTVLPPIPGDSLRHLGRRSDGSTVPIVPDELYQAAAVQNVARTAPSRLDP